MSRDDPEIRARIHYVLDPRLYYITFNTRCNVFMFC